MSAHRLGGRVNLGGRTNGYRAIKAQKRQRLGVTGRSTGLNIVCEKVGHHRQLRKATPARAVMNGI